MTTPVLDLLRERRQELGIEPLAPALAERPRLVRRGLLIGAALAGGVVALSLVLALWQQVLRARYRPLLRYEAEAGDLSNRIAARKGRVDRMVATNRKLAGALTTLRTTSALLSDLQLRTPEGVRLTAAEARGSDLVLKGQARDPQAFQRINALQLELQRSPLLKPGEANLGKIERVEARGGNARSAGRPVEPVAFELSTPFASLPPARQLQVLRALGSDGMARRLQLLQKEGLLQ
ncbi:MAG: PilN domain-containing protein [Synechococcaceae cyanobacterium]|nr:PilN domain-containing protein [Synechococcaceae cyanobacterium]